jgi:hypothetical protein
MPAIPRKFRHSCCYSKHIPRQSVFLFETIVIYSSKTLVGLYLLGKFLKPCLECADAWCMEKFSTQ